MKAFIEQIGAGHREISIFKGLFKFKKTPDSLYISNKPSYWILDLFRGYKQLGVFDVENPHPFKERMWIDVELDNKGKIIAVKWLSQYEQPQ